MHRPGDQQSYNQGTQFTRCCDCGVTLMVTHRGWKTIPPDKRVVWRPRTIHDIFFKITANTDRRRLRFDPLAPLKRQRPPGR